MAGKPEVIRLKISVLMENTPHAEGFASEHGLSLYIETQYQRILFDMGQSDGFTANAERLRIELAVVDFAVLSHGHYDHGGGLPHFLARNGTAPVYVNRRAFEPHYAEGGLYVGLDTAYANLPQIVPVEDSLSVAEGIALHSCNALPRPYPMDSYGLYVLENGKPVPDPFLHEQYLLIRENGQTVVISGCSHKGVLNILHWLQPDVFIGGFHYMDVDPTGQDAAVLDEAARVLLEHHTKYYTCHCTGLQQFAYLQKRVGASLAYISAGQVLQL
jgi:7,8-dihydropterin-6-yl-methyl-4-(beta-D-ribofuranosyl)aminobenzene 5'-phosphate synthase